MKAGAIPAILACAFAADSGAQAPRPALNQGAEIDLIVSRRIAEGLESGMVLPVSVRSGQTMPRTAQVTLECTLDGAWPKDCAVVSEAPADRGLGESLVAQSNLIWMRGGYRPNTRTVRVLFDITDRTAAIGRSDPFGAILLSPRAQPPERSGLRALDTNRDGRIDEREIYVMDADRDRFVTRAEFEKHFRFEPGGPGRSYAAFDRDFDGRVNVNEVMAAYRPGSVEDVAR